MWVFSIKTQQKPANPSKRRPNQKVTPGRQSLSLWVRTKVKVGCTRDLAVRPLEPSQPSRPSQAFRSQDGGTSMSYYYTGRLGLSCFLAPTIKIENQHQNQSFDESRKRPVDNESRKRQNDEKVARPIGRISPFVLAWPCFCSPTRVCPLSLSPGGVHTTSTTFDDEAVWTLDSEPKQPARQRPLTGTLDKSGSLPDVQCRTANGNPTNCLQLPLPQRPQTSTNGLTLSSPILVPAPCFLLSMSSILPSAFTSHAVLTSHSLQLTLHLALHSSRSVSEHKRSAISHGYGAWSTPP